MEELIPVKKWPAGKTILLTSTISVIVLVLIYLGFWQYGQSLIGKTWPSAHIGNFSVASLTASELTSFLQAMQNKLLGSEITIRLVAPGETDKTVKLSPEGVGDSSFDWFMIDTEQTLVKLLVRESDVNSPLWPFYAIKSWLKPTPELVVLRIENDRLQNLVYDVVYPNVRPVKNAEIVIKNVATASFLVERTQAGWGFSQQKIVYRQ